MAFEIRQGESFTPLSFSSVQAGDGTLYAASLGGSIYRTGLEGAWERLSNPVPEQLTVNRMALYGEQLFACTNKGLFCHGFEQWEEELEIPCFQYRVEGGCRYAATAYGLFCDQTGSWGSIACYDKRVYDFLNLPQLLILGHEDGLSIYDRMTDEWAGFTVGAGVTSLAVYKGHLLGSGEHGELIVGNKKGRFERIRFAGLFVYSVMKRGGHLFGCTDKGLYRIGIINGYPWLFSFVKGGPVIDIDVQNGQLFMATLYNGVKTVQLN
ncbi:hypothetical protein [uncultured Paenibacillus sp.]|uniref:hypothetical protein n=1 Tax=uncultured Paenibacillus sp. TaxID=227322 RepID=UPI0028D1A236|nr:hypothetical protein [uncultured Paenibacillus sp.]